jgi:hypothetical protein
MSASTLTKRITYVFLKEEKVLFDITANEGLKLFENKPLNP